MMNAQPTDRLLDPHLSKLRETFADTLIITDIIRGLESSPRADRLLPSLYTQLGTLQGVVRRARWVLKRAIPHERRPT
jgi:hypothetical protein